MRFYLVDRITELDSGQSISAVKQLSMAEEYLADHFPGFPVMPGVLMLEAMTQAGGWLMREATGFEYSTVMLKEVKALRYNNFVTPGDELRLTLTLHQRTDETWTLKGAGTVNGSSAVNARLVLQQFNLADTNPEMKRVDDTMRKAWRDLFAQINKAAA